ncbi:hypothetical protein QBC47DRAFT_387261 [Echria macrotheca]|uniref:Rhodopsin domain-containing protein n=1 Tax=Echria macrotheca TaxID=438768 RepID=A0AAJ0B7W3_9PEZI|nr:hypothetical protein QBC47DRAFT_387261 [Echria macrotheca]
MASSGGNYGPLLNLLIWTLAGASAAFLALRIWAKVRRDRKLWYDDHILVLAWTFLTAACILQTVDTTLGFGGPRENVDPSLVDTTRLVSTIAGFLLILATAWSKTSFALTLLRISTGWPKKIVMFVLVTTNLAIAASGAIQWAHCWPLRKVWEQSIDGYCWPLRITNGYNIFSSVYSGLMDLTLAALPWVIFRSSDDAAFLDWAGNKFRRKEMLNISVAMSMAVFAGIASFVKVFAIYQMNTVNAGPELIVTLMVLGTAESAVTIMAVSIPVLRTLEERMPKVVSA